MFLSFSFTCLEVADESVQEIAYFDASVSEAVKVFGANVANVQGRVAETTHF